MTFDPIKFEKAWTAHWASLHESAHAVTARHYGLTVNFVDLNRASIEHRFYSSPGCLNSKHRLIVSAAGDEAVAIFCKYFDTGTGDTLRSCGRLRDLGASESLTRRLLSDAKLEARSLVVRLKPQITAVAWALQQRQLLFSTEIDAVIQNAFAL